MNDSDWAERNCTTCRDFYQTGTTADGRAGGRCDQWITVGRYDIRGATVTECNRCSAWAEKAVQP